jgi:hypothetical protein
MKPIDYNLPAKEIATEELIEYYKFIKTPYPSQYPKIAIDLAIHQYERLKEVCEPIKWNSKPPYQHKNPTYTKILEVLDYLNSVK